MRHPAQAGIGLIRLGESGFVAANPEDDLRGKDVNEAEGQRVAAEAPAPTPASRRAHAAAYEATRQDMGSVTEEARTTPAASLLWLKWAGLALLVIAGLMAVYVGAGLFGELAAGAAYP